MPQPLRLLTLALLTLLPLGAARAQPFPDGARALFMGHSFFAPIAREFDDYATRSRAFPAHRVDVVQSGGQTGSPRQLWEDPRDLRAATRVLRTGQVDLVGFTHHGEIGSALADYRLWVDLALSYNPNTRFMIASPWVGGGTRLSQSDFVSMTALSASYGQSMVQTLRRTYPGVEFYHIAHGTLMPIMREDFVAGQLDDLTTLVGNRRNRGALFTDNNLGHAGQMAKDMMALIWLSELYGLPRRLPNTWNAADTSRLLSEGQAQAARYD